MTALSGFPEVDALLARIDELAEGKAQEDFLLFLGGRVGTLAESFARDGVPAAPNGRPLELFYDRVSATGKPYKSKFKSLKQQRYVAMLYKSGKAPYVRSGALPNSITHQVTIAGRGVVIAIGTNLSYAEYVIGPPDVQNHYHAETGWKSLDDTIAQHVPEYRDEIVTSGEAYLIGYLRGR